MIEIDDLRPDRTTRQSYICHVNSAGIFPVQWSLKNGLHLSPPPGMSVLAPLWRKQVGSPQSTIFGTRLLRNNCMLQHKQRTWSNSEKQELWIGETEISWVHACIWEDDSGWGDQSYIKTWTLEWMEYVLVPAIINLISEASIFDIVFLLLVRMEHCCPTLYRILRR